MPPRSRVQSRNHSRAASPTLSVRSRRSMMSSRQRNKYMHQDLTDDEDSDLDNFTDDSRSRIRRHDGRNKPKKYAESFDFDGNESDVRHNRIQRMKDKSKYIRERRSGSLTNWPTNNRDSGSMSPVSDEDIRKTSSKFRKASLSTAVPYSSKITLDSASEREIAHKRISSPPVSNNSKESRHLDAEKLKKSQTSSKPVRPVKSPSVSEEEEEEEEEEEDIPAPVVIKKQQQEAPKSIMSDKSSDREPIQRDNLKSGKSSVPEKPITNGHKETPAVKKPVQRVSSETQSEPPVVKKVKEIPKKIEVPVVVKEPVKIKQQPTTSKAVPVKEPTIDKQVPSTSKAVTKSKPQITKPANEDWECEHCTYVNEALAPICAVCCKTPAVRLQQLPPSDDEADVDLSNVNDTISQNENDFDAKQKGKNKKISFLPGTKAH